MTEISHFKMADPRIESFSEFPLQLYGNDPYFSSRDFFHPELETECFLAFKQKAVVGRAAALINPHISFRNFRTGLIGYFECQDDLQVSRALFKAVSQFLGDKNCEYLIGPLNGSTWLSYRVTMPDSDPPFFLDNYHRKYYAAHFQDFGFNIIGQYVSSRLERQCYLQNPRMDKFTRYFDKKGFRFRPVDLDHFHADLRLIYQVASESFKNNFLFSPISLELFSLLYERIKAFVNPQFSLLCQDNQGKPVGFIFALDNVFAKNKKSLVLKTVAIGPDRIYRGLGTFLVEKIHSLAFAMGIEEIIHALMYEKNISLHVAGDQTQPFRVYHLYGKKL